LSELRFKIELNVLNHLGIGLYSSTPAVVTEIISNAWDAEATRVEIVLRPDDDIIVVEDDGHGMQENDVRNKFLKVGYSRRIREPSGAFSKSKTRRVMGRKGIGKLAMFSLANNIEIVTKAEGAAAVAFKIDVAKLKELASGENEILDYPVEVIDVPEDFKKEQGTRIKLTSLNSRINKTEPYLRSRLVRRFGVFGDDFQVVLNGAPIERKDAAFYSEVQFLWYFDETTKNALSGLTTNLASVTDEAGVSASCLEAISAVIPGDIPDLTLQGFIATVDSPNKLGRGDESLNKISIFANGRLFQEDILSELGDTGYFNNYIVGEVYADFLDRDEIDRATASREAIKHDDAKFQALRVHLRNCLKLIRDRWDDWRRALGYIKTGTPNPGVIKWLATLSDKRDRRAADRLMTSIGNLSISNDEAANTEAKRLLYRSAIVGFEKLRSRQQLSQLEKITDVLSPEFQAIFANLDDIEESHYLDITRQRLEIIRKFSEEIVDEGKLEKVAQNYLFDHLWLLDPIWDRVSGSEEIERTMTAELKKACPDSEAGARLDIAYKTTAGRHVIIELKRPGLKVKADDLEGQGRKYVEAMEQYYIDRPDYLALGGRTPPIDVYFLISTRPHMSERQENAFSVYNMKILTYGGLITRAKATYQDYLQVKAKVGKLEMVLEEI
jgi:hypothetical protein